MSAAQLSVPQVVRHGDHKYQSYRFSKDLAISKVRMHQAANGRERPNVLVPRKTITPYVLGMASGVMIGDSASSFIMDVRARSVSRRRTRRPNINTIDHRQPRIWGLAKLRKQKNDTLVRC